MKATIETQSVISFKQRLIKQNDPVAKTKIEEVAFQSDLGKASAGSRTLSMYDKLSLLSGNGLNPSQNPTSSQRSDY